MKVYFGEVEGTEDTLWINYKLAKREITTYFFRSGDVSIQMNKDVAKELFKQMKKAFKERKI